MSRLLKVILHTDICTATGHTDRHTEWSRKNCTNFNAS